MKQLLSKLFSAKEVLSNNQSVIVKDKVSKSETESLIEQIHSEFYCASDILLAEAKEVISKAENKEIIKGNRLSSLGFKNTREAVVASNIIHESKKAEDIQKAIIEYSVKYPNNKFITEGIVKSICQKYNLVFGKSELYKGFVPEKNLKEIEVFLTKYNTKDSIVLSDIRPYSTNGIEIPTSSFVLKEAIAKRDNHGYHHIYKKNVGDFKNYAFQSDNGINWYGSDSNNLFGLRKYGDFRFTISENSLMICAPIKDMDTTGYNLKGYKLEKHIPDPVVLYPVESGYICVTMWGDEASDPELNTLNN